HVAHVQTAGNIRRRQQQGKNWVRVARSRCRSRKELFLHPVFGPPRLDGRGLVRLGKLIFRRTVGHENTQTQPSAISHWHSCCRPSLDRTAGGGLPHAKPNG